MKKEMEKFSFWKTFLLIFLITSILSSIISGFLGLYKKDIIDGLIGLIILVFVSSMVFTFVAKWLKDYKRTGKWFVLKNEKTKWWHFLFLILFLVLSVYIILGAISVIGIENNPPIRIIPEEYNPWSWYT